MPAGQQFTLWQIGCSETGRSCDMKRFLILMLLAGGSLFARTRVSIGIGVGGYGYDPYAYGGYYAYYPPPPPPPAYYAPSYVRPGYSWIDGYWYPYGGRYSLRAGYLA